MSRAPRELPHQPAVDSPECKLAAFGGLAGARFKCSVTSPDGTVREVPAKGAVVLVRNGDRVEIQPAGSGGYGDPLQRSRDAVKDDLVDGYVTEAAAQRLYGLDARSCT